MRRAPQLELGVPDRIRASCRKTLQVVRNDICHSVPGESRARGGRTSGRPRIPCGHARAGICPAGPVGQPGRGSALRRVGRVVSARVDGDRRRFCQGHPCLVPTWWFRLGDQEDRTNQPVSGGRIMPHQKWPPSLSQFIQCGSLPGGRRRKTLAAHVTTEPKRVVTWAPPLYGNNLSTSSAQWVPAVVPLEPLQELAKCVGILVRNRAQCH